MVELTQLSQSINRTEATAWDAFVAAHPHGHLLQTSAWGALKSQFEWSQGLVTLMQLDGQIHAGALLLYRRKVGITLAYAPKGPLVDWQDREQTLALLEKLKQACREQGTLFLKIEPDLPDTPSNRACLASYGFRPSPQTVQPQSTAVIQLKADEPAILQQMKSKWRYNIRLAERKEVTVREMTRADLSVFNALMSTTGVRDGFAVHSAAYYRAAFDLLVPRHAVFLLAEYAGQPLAAIVVGITGKSAWYLWGASSDCERNRMPNHALQWAGIRWAQAHGATRYDFWGIPDDLGKLALGLGRGDASGTPVDDLPVDLEAFPNQDLWGVYRFKQGFGGQVVRFVGAWDLPINPLGYRLYTTGLAVQKQVQEIRRQGIGHWGLGISRSGSISQAPRATLHLEEVEHDEQWRKVLTGMPAPHVLQSWEWGQVKGQTEWVAERYILAQGEQPQAAWQYLWRQPLPYLPLRVAYIPKGPMLDWTRLDLVDATLAMIEAQARAQGSIFVKLDPDVRADTTAGRLVLHALQRRGWRYSQDQIQFKNTAFSDLAVGEEALLEGMKSKWRYNIRLAERRGIQVRVGGVEDLPAFYSLYAETGQRDGFLIRPFTYYRTTWQTFLEAQADPANPAGGALLLAWHPEDRQPVAGIFLMRYGQRAWYFYGASSERQRRDMPNHLLQWEAIRWALRHGCTTYDWWGAPTQLDDPTDSMQGVWQFKQGFGAKFQPHIGAWDFPVSPALYRLYTEAMPQLLKVLRRRHQVDSRNSPHDQQSP